MGTNTDTILKNAKVRAAEAFFVHCPECGHVQKARTQTTGVWFRDDFVKHYAGQPVTCWNCKAEMNVVAPKSLHIAPPPPLEGSDEERSDEERDNDTNTR